MIEPFDVDIVVLWVDGADPKWQEEKRKYQEKQGIYVSRESNTAARYRDWGLMKYWFRGIETFAPWARTVHFVTYGHLPDFLKTDAPKLHIVNHRDYLPSEFLPLFNSRALEINLHRIPGLADRFVYFNDDMFLLQKTKQSDFFDRKTGLPKLHYVECPLRLRGTLDAEYMTLVNTMGLINKNISKKSVPLRSYFGKQVSFQNPPIQNIRNLAMKILYPEYYTGFKIFHEPGNFMRSTFLEVWWTEPSMMNETSRHRFRELRDLNQWTLLLWQEARGKFSPGKSDNYLVDISEQEIGNICRVIQNQEHKMICVNDEIGEGDFEMLAGKLQNAFETILPNKSSFEK